MADAGIIGPHDTSAARQEKAKLRKVLGRLDLVLFTACAILGYDTVAATAEAGAQAITWLAISLVIFLIPYGMLMAELGAAFPVEGGPYEWARMAFVWVTVAIAIMAFKYGKWGPNVGTFVKIAVVVIFTVLFIAFLTKHGHPAGGSHLSDLKPSLNGFLVVIGLLVFLWVGFELSNGAAEEMRNPQRDVPKMIFSAGVICAVVYGLLIVGIILVVPKAGLQNVSGFVDAYNAVAASLHSRLLDVIFGIFLIITLLSSGAVWLEGADRTQAIASLDGAGPKWMGKFTNFGTPIAVNLASGVVGSIFVLVVLLVTKGQLENFFSVMLSLTISTTAVSYFFILPALVRLRKLYPAVERPYRVPGGMAGAWAATIITEAFVVVTAVTLLWPGAINNLFGESYSMQSNWGVSRLFFETVTFGAFIVLVLIGVAFWAIGERNRRRGLLGPEAGEAVAD
ncbi:MAG TPA: APC family permease [Streptosporangiaceae bacterium]|jgi:amino acid transporter